MRKPALLSMIAFLMLTPLGVSAGQTADSAKGRQVEQQKSKKLVTISGKVSSEGTTFTADKDGRIWRISNPESLTGIEGLRVKVKAHVDLAQNQIQNISVHAVPEQGAGIKFDDAAFRR